MSKDEADKKIYLGDSVYVAMDALGRIILTTENGYEPSNTIILEPEVYLALTRLVDRVAWRDVEEADHGE